MPNVLCHRGIHIGMIQEGSVPVEQWIGAKGCSFIVSWTIHHRVNWEDVSG